ncbi:MAG: ABC transporter ATP-binding protein [Kiritimatiellae bacterium]|nr:ABC transporter ATP-binding protein [Kiritimatiellia bacterium]
MLQLSHMSKTYCSDAGSSVAALDGLDLTVGAGEFVVLIGPTGCGKTTLLNIVAGLDSPDAGEVRRANGLLPGRNMPCVFQHYTLFPWRTLLRNVTFGLEMRGTPRADRLAIAANLLAKVGLTGFEQAYPHELSGGMRQRAAIAQALATEPKLLLMDEPFGAVDDATRRDLQQALVDLWQEGGMTVLFVTHNIDEAVVLGSRVSILSARPGRIVREFRIDLPRPRRRTDGAFADQHLRIREALICETGKPDAA